MLSKIEQSQIKSYIKDYLKKRIPNFKSKSKLFTCPKCGKVAANVFPPNSNNVFCYEPSCKKIGDIFAICRMIDFEGNEDVSDKDIAKFLKKEFMIQTNDDIEQLLGFYSALGWDLVPVSKNSKASDIEKEWQKKSHKDLNEWRQWLSSSLNIGVKTGVMSQVIVIDFDIVSKHLKKKIYEEDYTEKEFENAKKTHEEGIKKLKEKLSFLNWETLQQNTFGGIHFFIKYDEEIPQTCFNWEGIHIDIKSNGGQVVVAPSIVGGQSRKIIGEEIKSASKELKEWILKNSQNGISSSDELDLVSCDGEEKIIGLDGKCNSTFIKVGGILRTFLTPKEVEKALTIINQEMLEEPMDRKSISAMCSQLSKYNTIDESALFKKIVDYFVKHNECSARDLKECLKAEPNDIKEVLAELLTQEKIYKQRSIYKRIINPEWKTHFVDEIKILPYQVPYFSDYAIFRTGDMICIGGSPGAGKTHISMNFVKKFVDQGLFPKYYGTESKSRFLQVAMEIGIKEGQFGWDSGYEPEKIELLDNDITILDWVWPENLAETANLYKLFQKQLDKHNGLLIVFSQLRSDKTFYAETQLKMFASVVTKYLYTEKNGIVDYENTYFQTEKIRESKVFKQFLTIPTKYNHSNKLIEIRK